MALSGPDFDYIPQMVKTSSAIVLEDAKAYLVELRLGILANKEGFASLNSLSTGQAIYSVAMALPKHFPASSFSAMPKRPSM